MPQITGPISETKYSKTPSGGHRDWIRDSRFPVFGTRRLRTSDDNRYRVIASAYGVSQNALLEGEIMAGVSKENGRVLFPVTLCTFLRTSENIRESNEAAIVRGEEDIEFFLYCAEQLKKNWFQMGASRNLLSEQLYLIVERLLRAHTMNRLAAGTTLEQYVEFLDSLRRLNPLITRGKLNAAVGPIAAQVGIDEGSVEAIMRRIAIAGTLWAEVEWELDFIMELTQEPLTTQSINELVEGMEGLQLKPYNFAVSYALNLLAQPRLDSNAHGLIRSAFVAETMLIGVEAALSQIKHNPTMLDRITVTQFERALPVLEFDDCYADLMENISRQYSLMAEQFRQKNYGMVSSMAENLQNVIRYRGGSQYTSIWRQPPIIGGRQLSEHPALPAKYAGIRQPA